MYYAEEAYGINKTAGWISSSGKLAYRIPDTLSGKIFYPVYYGAKTIKEKGVYIEDVTSESENTYPKDGISGSYYYVFKYAVPGVPSITVPGAAMIGHAVDISWEAADSAESYKLERRVDSGGWTQVYEGAGLTYADTVQVEWSNVQYRVSASISGVYGDPILSKTVNIVPSTTLRISMPEGNIGEIKGAITYTALSDAPRDAIYISEVFENTYSDYQRELTLKPGDSVTIPVSRFPSAAGGRFTVKAKVQISDNAWANENRQLSYTKTPTSMPDSPYRVERLQGKECDVMPQTLAEAVMMPDGSSVADKLGGATLEGAAVGAFTSSVTLPFTPDAVWVIYGGEGANSIPPFAMLYPKVRAQISTGNNRSQYVTWDGSTNINSTGNPAQPLNYVALKFGGAS